MIIGITVRYNVAILVIVSFTLFPIMVYDYFQILRPTLCIVVQIKISLVSHIIIIVISGVMQIIADVTYEVVCKVLVKIRPPFFITQFLQNWIVLLTYGQKGSCQFVLVFIHNGYFQSRIIPDTYENSELLWYDNRSNIVITMSVTYNQLFHF